MATGFGREFRGAMTWRGFRKTLLSGVAVSATFAAAHAQVAPATSTNSTTTTQSSGKIESVTVTAQRRVQNLQDVPVSIQVLSGATLKKMNVENFDDLVAALPNVTVAGYGPGQENIYIRGLALGGGGNQESGVIGSFPNVAVYLDDVSEQVPGRNLDVYAVDLQQVEVLEGPQGTLFGSGAQAGVVRYITNKPDLSRYGGTIDVGGADTEHGAPSGSVDATINIPIVKDQIALRITGYDDKRGGYINNVPGTFIRQATDKGIYYAGYTNGIPGPANASNSANNSKLAKNNINPVTYEGFRAELEWKFNEDWNALLTESAQRLDAQGVFYEEPYSSGSNPQKLPPLSVQLYNPTYSEDQYENTALTLNGRVGFLNLVYDGAYLVRHTTSQQDYTNYARGVYADYYQCLPASKSPTGKAKCYSPSATWDDHEQDMHVSQEFRASTPDDWRLRAIGGAYYEDFLVKEQTNFDYRTAPGTDLGPAPGSDVSDPSPRAEDTGFFTDAKRGYLQYAAFGSVDFDIIPKVLTITGGTRWFAFDEFEKGSYAGGFGCGESIYSGPYSLAYPCTVGAHNLGAENLRNKAYGFKSRANITWKIIPSIMVYYTWSQGYRPGGYNRSAPIGDFFYNSDNLTNNEIGYKATFLDHRLVLDGAFYMENWDNVQATLFDPGLYGNLAFTVNGPSYRVLGTEIQATAEPIDDLTLNVNTALTSSKQTTAPTVGDYSPFTQGATSLAQSPAFKASFRARYEWSNLSYAPYVQLMVTHTSHTHSTAAGDIISVSPTFQNRCPAFSTDVATCIYNFYEDPSTKLDISAGATFGAWSAQIFVDNVTNEHAQQFINSSEFVQAIVVDRPLTGGAKLTYHF
jgi:outer membrane receptor protein involved in Fe transport